MTITRPHVCELNLADAEADDHGQVVVALHANSGVIFSRELTPTEARELAAEITAAADVAAAYLLEQNGRGR